jgi:hypothetical protein
MLPDDPSAAVSNRPTAAKTNPEPKPADEAGRAAADTERPRLQLTATQILAGIAASVTAAILGSRLGVAGTVLGAALASGISITGSAVYAHSIRATRHRVRQAVNRWRPEGAVVARSNDPFALTRAQVVVGRGVAFWRSRPRARAVALSPGAPVGRPRRSAPTRSTGPTRRPWWAGLAVGIVGTAVVFGAALALVTGIEVVKGSPLSGGATGGLSVLGGSRAGGSVPDPASPVREAPARSSAGDPSGRLGADQSASDPTSGSGAPADAANSSVTTGGSGQGAGGTAPGTGGATSRSGASDPTSPATGDGAAPGTGAAAGGSRTTTTAGETDPALTSATPTASVAPTAPTTRSAGPSSSTSPSPTGAVASPTAPAGP